MQAVGPGGLLGQTSAPRWGPERGPEWPQAEGYIHRPEKGEAVLGAMAARLPSRTGAVRGQHCPRWQSLASPPVLTTIL